MSVTRTEPRIKGTHPIVVLKYVLHIERRLSARTGQSPHSLGAFHHPPKRTVTINYRAALAARKPTFRKEFPR